VRQVLANLLYAHLPRVVLVVEQDELLDGLDVSLFRADAIMLEPEVVAHLVEQRRLRGRLLSHG
jgi:hypothetical protein